jgi:hypothetical protein
MGKTKVVAGVIPPVPGEDGSPPPQHAIIPCQPAAWRRQRTKKSVTTWSLLFLP